MKNLLYIWNKLSLVKQIIIGLITGIILSLTIPEKVKGISIFGNLFVGALKSVAPVLVLFLVMSAICQHKSGKKTNMKSIIGLYAVGTFLAAIIAVAASFIFPITLTLSGGIDNVSPPGGVGEVLNTLMMNVVDNPIRALSNANYIGILSWALILGFALRSSADSTKLVISNFSDAVSKVVELIIRFAPIGIMGLVFDTISTNGIESLLGYGQLLLLLIGCMIFVALVVNPLIVYINIHRNPYPLVIKCLKESGITAFFTRSSAANIPVNMKLCEDLGLNRDTYSISIPLGSTINMGGAAVTISVLSLAAANTLGIQVDVGTALLLSLLSAVCACGTSGIAGGSLLLVPLACSLFGIPNEIAMKVVAVGFVVGVLQDSSETALNSSTDVLFTAAAEFAERRKSKKESLN
ncbi:MULTISPECIES: serine/threonine transporter SstT [Clostridium]|uniref:Serine/threonine transporter SstT n=1 Tax=Clostridium butyricum E4 str. BoNT E BL5262 TaxID=632245 RepID=C4IBV4_CLOBU|nr:MULTISPECIES: serine/threonine transporter SstT [Clostridium]APF21256.1 dicarboxylate symporter family protein [Clostridium butyricum]AXB87163.1 serine/threonine transporter SstT [Clostridium butyricum]EDT74073.1 inner membrane symporter YgjU [Clostridium butyricum 5521]EEP56364.1 serine/threonine transporter SstT (Na(+)/serine-threonine symporter) [Clostridium butyricum E4 str. BoNT E BL5262]KIU05054.1 inner membrane symporter YgjU [Clostridium butyricum]